MPVEVALALRGPDWHAPFEPLPPVTQLVPITSSAVEREAAVAATAFAAQAASVLSACATAPPTERIAAVTGQALQWYGPEHGK